MIPFDIDPSLHAAEPPPPQLDDGFSPPPAEQEVPGVTVNPADPLLWVKSDF